MALIQTVHLSMANFKSAPVVPAVQNDTDRQIKMVIDDFDLTAGLTGKITFVRSDGTHYEASATLDTATNSFTADIDQALTQPGRTMVQLKVTDTLTVSTFSFVIFVEEDTSGTVTPQEGIDLVTAVEAAEAAADRAESAAETLELDATLTSATKAAQAKAVGDAFDEISIAEVIESANLFDISTVTEDKYMWNGVEYDSASYFHSDFIPVETGKTYSWQYDQDNSGTSRGNKSIRFLCTYNSNKEHVASYENTSAVDGYTAASGVAYIILSDSIDQLTYSFRKPALVEGLTVLPYSEYVAPYVKRTLKAVNYDSEQELTDAQKATARNNIGAASANDIEQPITLKKLATLSLTWTDGYYMNGWGIPVSNSSYTYSNKIPVNSGDVIIGHMRFMTAYSDENTAVNSQFQDNIANYTVPDNIKYIVISIDKTHKDWNISKKTTETVSKNELCFDVFNTSKKGALSNKTTGQVDSTHTLSLIRGTYRKGFSISFFGKITSFASIGIGIGNYTSGANASGFIIDGTNVSYYNGSLYSQTAHSLTISEYIAVKISVDSSTNKPKISILTSSGAYTLEIQTAWVGAPHPIIASSSDSVLTDCTLTEYVDDIKKSIWYMGDSYMSPGDSSRLPNWFISMGSYKSICSIGYSGCRAETIISTINALFNADLYPSYLIWGVGMNDGDSSSAINAAWKAFTDALIEICDSCGVEIILCTIPNTPTVNNSYKNAYVRASGKRYIDYAAAVNTSESGTEWIPGTLSNDNTHPTQEGAKLLAFKCISDFSEILS